MARRLALVLAAVVALAAGAASPAAARKPGRMPCTDRADSAIRFSIPVEGQQATGFYALPRHLSKGIVVFSHGYGHSSYSWQEHLKRTARELRVVAVAMDYRGISFDAPPEQSKDGIPRTRGWPVSAGAEDGIAAAQRFEASCRTAKTIVNYGVSMGGNTSGLMAAAGALRTDRVTPLFDWLIDIEGVANVTETYLEARASGATEAEEDISAEMGGPLEEVPDAYRSHSVVTRTGDMKAAGLKDVVRVQGIDDGLVPFNQSPEFVAALRSSGLPVQMFSVTLKGGEPDRDTTISGIVGKQLDPEYQSPLAGHASERSTTHVVGTTGFDRLTAIFAGDVPTCDREHVVVGRTAIVPPPTPC